VENVLLLHVDESLDGTRLDRALAQLMPDASRSAVARYIDDGLVSVNGVTATKRSQPVLHGASITVRVSAPVDSGIVSQDLPIVILYEDADLAVINKAAGIVVHPAAGHADNTLVNALLFHLDNLSGLGGEIRPGIVHRLDKDTSGVLVVAKNDKAHAALTSVWNSDAVEKEYLALVYGTPKKASGSIEAPIGRDPRDRKKMAVVPSGRSAITLYKIAETLPHLSLIRCRLKTGRTHQIRVHLKHLGHPIVGDPLYSGAQWRGIPNKPMQKLLAAFDRQALHAAKLTFPHPRTGEKMTFEAPLPADMAELIEALRRA
jgi:23S rRNA pseudouridine1911/1915/1917 synthase